MRTARISSITIFFVFLSISCSAKCDSSKIREAIMTEGMTISAATSHGLLVIRAGNGCEREYTWNGEKFKAELTPRTEEWSGHFGLYGPALRPPFPSVVHMVAQEHPSKYQSEAQFFKHREDGENPDVYEVYNDDGLLLRFIKRVSPTGQIALNVFVSQILINGTKPVQLKGSRNTEISVAFE